MGRTHMVPKIIFAEGCACAWDDFRGLCRPASTGSRVGNSRFDLFQMDAAWPVATSVGEWRCGLVFDKQRPGNPALCLSGLRFGFCSFAAIPEALLPHSRVNLQRRCYRMFQVHENSGVVERTVGKQRPEHVQGECADALINE